MAPPSPLYTRTGMCRKRVSPPLGSISRRFTDLMKQISN
jgi:hypothetical protein